MQSIFLSSPALSGSNLVNAQYHVVAIGTFATGWLATRLYKTTRARSLGPSIGISSYPLLYLPFLQNLLFAAVGLIGGFIPWLSLPNMLLGGA